MVKTDSNPSGPCIPTNWTSFWPMSQKVFTKKKNPKKECGLNYGTGGVPAVEQWFPKWEVMMSGHKRGRCRESFGAIALC